jgi:ubiquinone/menaquinone biosynthesis C-methylase UbiE
MQLRPEDRLMSSREYFDEVAGQWDRLRQAFFSDAVREAAISKADLRPGTIAADLGVGTGFVTEGLLQRGLRVLAVDQSREMLEVLSQKFLGSEGLDCRLGEAESLPIDTGSVDAVFANMYLHHVDTPSKAIGEMARILVPGGRVVITDLDQHSFDFLRAEQHDRWLGFSREEIRRWMSEAGLGDIEVDCVGQDCCATSACANERARVSIFVASAVK